MNTRLRRPGTPSPHLLEGLESRLLLSLSPWYFRARQHPVPPHKYPGPQAFSTVMRADGITPSATAPPGSAYTPAQLRHAYGFDQVSFGAAAGDGAGQTIAIIDAYDDPNALPDLQAFDARFGLPDPPSFQRVAQDGSQNFPAPASTGSWGLEISLDIEWAHAIAPAANLLLVEANDSSFSNLIQHAAVWASQQPGVSVVSMSFGTPEFSGESGSDSSFNRTGVTFVASTGDSAAPASFPAFSPNVVAVGGTSLSIDSAGNYIGESAWSGSGGGVSAYEAQPAYQKGIVPISLTTSQRTAPDLSMDANPSTGVAVFDSFDYPGSPWIQLGGTSLSAPLFAGLVAVANQGRATVGLSPLTGATQTLPILYSLSASYYHDVTSGTTTGSPNYSAAAGYDLATGRGAPIANQLVFGLMGTGAIAGTVFQDNNSDGLRQPSEPLQSGVTVYIDSNNNGLYDPGVSTTSAQSTSATIPSRNASLTSTLSLSGTSSPLSNLAVSFTESYARSVTLTVQLIAPDGTPLVLFSGASGTGTQTIHLSDQASQSITSTSGTFSGAYTPAYPLADFNGKSASGTWSLKLSSDAASTTGTLSSWSLTATTGPADVYATTTDANGQYAFKNLPLGANYTVQEIVPPTFIRTAPLTDTPPAIAPLTSPSTTLNLTNFPTIFTTASNTDSFTLAADATHTWLDIFSGTSATGSPAYIAPLAALASLTFNLTGNANALVLDFSNGTPLPPGNISLFTASGSSDELRLLGQNPLQTFTLTNTQLALAGGSAVNFQSLPVLTLSNCTVNSSGDLSTIGTLNILSGATFNW